MKKPINSGVNSKKKMPRGKPFKKNDPTTGEIDDRINRLGAPPLDARWSEQLTFWQKHPPEVIASVLTPSKMQRGYKKLPRGLALRHIRVLNYLLHQATAANPSAALLQIELDRVEGKLPNEMQLEGTLEVVGLQEALKKVYGNDDNPG